MNQFVISIFLIIIYNFGIIEKSINAYAKNENAQHSSDINIIKKVTKEFCDSKQKRLFKGLDQEKTLKYEYFFSSIPKNSVIDKSELIDNLFSNINLNCSYKVSDSEKKDFEFFLNKFLKDK